MDDCVSEKDRSCYNHVIRTYQRRCRARSLLSQYRKNELDYQLSEAINSFNNYHFNSRYSKTSTARHIVRLLSLGAIASKLPLPCYQDNVAYMMDLLDSPFSGGSLDPPKETLERRVFYVLNNLVLSSCDSWHTQVYELWNSGVTLIEFIVSLILTGESYCVYGYPNFTNRYRAWSLYKKMVWVIEYANRGKAINGLIPLESLHNGYSNTFQWAIEEASRSTSTNRNMKLCVEFANFFRLRSYIRRLDVVSDQEHSEFEEIILKPTQTASRMMKTMIGTPFFNHYQRKFSLNSNQLNQLFASRETRKELFQIISDKSLPEHLYGENFIRDLCRRRERKLLIHLLNSDDKEAGRIVQIALKMLQSNEVRGRKEKMIWILQMKQREINLRRFDQRNETSDK